MVIWSMLATQYFFFFFFEKWHDLIINFAICFAINFAGLHFHVQNQQGLTSCVCRWTVASARRWFDHYHQVESSEEQVNAQWVKAFLRNVEHFGVHRDESECSDSFRLWGEAEAKASSAWLARGILWSGTAALATLQASICRWTVCVWFCCSLVRRSFFLQQQGTDSGRVTASIYSVGLTVKCNSKLGLKHIYIISLLSF